MNRSRKVTGDDRAAVRFTVVLDPVHHVYPLEQHAAKDDRPVGYLIRKAIEEYLERHPMEHCT